MRSNLIKYEYDYNFEIMADFSFPLYGHTLLHLINIKIKDINTKQTFKSATVHKINNQYEREL